MYVHIHNYYLFNGWFIFSKLNNKFKFKTFYSYNLSYSTFHSAENFGILIRH